METQKNPKFSCKKCTFITSNKKDWARHLSTAKHILSQGVSNLETELPHFTPDDKNIFSCYVCKNIYKTRAGLWKHSKKCSQPSVKDVLENNDPTELKDIILQLIQQNQNLCKQMTEQNQDLSKQIIDIAKNTNTNTNNSNNNNNNTINTNNNFKLQVFLQETCKNAMNITDFINSIQPTLKDLENVGRVGYAEGISQIIINKLNDTEVTERPIHCSDLKREIMYIKNENVWSKETCDKPILLKAIKEVANKNIQNILEWQKANPGCTQSDSRKNNLYLDIVSNSMCGSDKEETNKNFNKIISKLSKKVAISECK
jgi:hypothetical protein